jgi:hypothetical protein
MLRELCEEHRAQHANDEQGRFPSALKRPRSISLTWQQPERRPTEAGDRARRHLARFRFQVFANNRKPLGFGKPCDGGALGFEPEARALLPLRRNPQIGDRTLHVQTAYHRLRFGRSAKSSNLIALSSNDVAQVCCSSEHASHCEQQRKMPHDPYKRPRLRFACFGDGALKIWPQRVHARLLAAVGIWRRQRGARSNDGLSRDRLFEPALIFQCLLQLPGSRADIPLLSGLGSFNQ